MSLIFNKTCLSSYQKSTLLHRSVQPWSRITDYESYSNFQNTIRNLSESQGMSPIEFEMKKLWS